MLLLIIIGFIVIPPIGSGIAMGVKFDKHCRDHGSATRITGWTLEMSCDPELKDPNGSK